MNSSGRDTRGHQDAHPEAGGAEQDVAGRRPGGHGPTRYARPALVAGAVLALVCTALLVIVFSLDTFNAAVYSVGGKDVQDATDEARSIRESYSTARFGGVLFLVAGLALAAAGGFLLYRDRNTPGRSGAGDGDEEVDFEDLRGQEPA